MKKLLKIFGALFLLIILFFILVILYGKFYPDATVGEYVHGNSMSQFGLTDGTNYRIYINHNCEVGDICSFSCGVEKCKIGGNGNGIKKLISIENDCYWFQGNDLNWIENGRNTASFDSRVYGCLTPLDFKLNGVLK